MNAIPRKTPRTFDRALGRLLWRMLRKESEERPAALDILNTALLQDLVQATHVQFSLPQGEASSTKTMTVRIERRKKRDSESYDSEDFEAFDFNNTIAMIEAGKAEDEAKDKEAEEEEAQATVRKLFSQSARAPVAATLESLHAVTPLLTVSTYRITKTGVCVPSVELLQSLSEHEMNSHVLTHILHLDMYRLSLRFSS